MTKEPLVFEYEFHFDGDESKRFVIEIDPDRLITLRRDYSYKPDWARLRFYKCSVCEFNEEECLYCPCALNLAEVVEDFREYFSHTDCLVRVKTPYRDYEKRTHLDIGLSSLMGLLMATSGCPAIEALKPMARFHLPFSSIEETTFRAIGMFLIAQWLRTSKGFDGQLDISPLKEIYERINRLNQDFSRRLRAASEEDATLNALTNLDCFASVFTSIGPDEVLEHLSPIFSYYLS